MDYLDQYKPTLPNLLQDFTVEDDLIPEDKAFKTYKFLLIAKRNNEVMFLVIGKLLKEIRDNNLYKYLDYDSFNQFVSSQEVGYSKESSYLFIRSYEYLVEHLQLDPDAIGKMNISRINMMIPVLKKIEEESGKEEAIGRLKDLDTLGHRDFVQEINKDRKSSKPQVYWSQELEKWIVSYFEGVTILQSRGEFK